MSTSNSTTIPTTSTTTPPPPPPPPPPDPFDTLLSLEETYYTEGHTLGTLDGSRAGRIEGRVFGLEKGFEKFFAMGALAGRCAVWDARRQINTIESSSATSRDITENAKEGIVGEDDRRTLPPLASNPRLDKHLQTLYALTEAQSLSTENNEDAVSDFDDRFKRAEGKVKVIEKILGEGPLVLDEIATTSNADRTVERRQIRVKRENNAGGESSMEDFNIRGARS